MESTKYCKHCGEKIDIECIVCPKCGKQVEQLVGNDTPIIINNSASSSASAASSATTGKYCRKVPWYLSWFWIVVFGFMTGGLYFIVGFILRVIWKSKN